MLSAACAPGIESEAVRLVTWEEIPWGQLAFPSVRWSLERFRDQGAARVYAAAPMVPLTPR